MSSLTIGQLARRAEVPIDTIRYYERNRLIAEPPRRPSGYRQYPEETLQRLRFIRRAKTLGFTLEEIAELLALSGRRDVAAVKRGAQRKLEALEQRIAELTRIRDGLARLVRACSGHGRVEDCPILSALNEDLP
ncbi:MAG: MerR family transcriptional regulator [Sinobacteraceae bacterium]|nr:MerR family transcriptional regulator [Nevskiaceae bacterium]